MYIVIDRLVYIGCEDAPNEKDDYSSDIIPRFSIIIRYEREDCFTYDYTYYSNDKQYEKYCRNNLFYFLDFAYKKYFWSCRINVKQRRSFDINSNIDFLPGFEYLENSISYKISIDKGKPFRGELPLQSDTDVNKLFSMIKDKL